MNLKRYAMMFVLMSACAANAASANEPKDAAKAPEVKQPVVTATETASATTTAPVTSKIITLEELEKSLPPAPINIGLDVDDTALFSSPGFFYAFNNTDGENGANIYGEKPLSNPQFWDDQDSKFDKFSIPKLIAKKVIDMHKKRGDKVFFITARPEDEDKDEILSDLLRKAFDLPKDSPNAIFTGYVTKAKFIKENNVVVYYGDSDTDITEATDAGCRPIRFMRSPLSTNKGKYNPGCYGEDILENSAD